jgi:hypothetical protein
MIEIKQLRFRGLEMARSVAGISLKRAAELSVHFDRSRNSTLVAGLGKAAAEHIAETLVASGASVAVLESPQDTPMMCCPEAEHRFKWSRLRTLVRLIWEEVL